MPLNYFIISLFLIVPSSLLANDVETAFAIYSDSDRNTTMNATGVTAKVPHDWGEDHKTSVKLGTTLKHSTFHVKDISYIKKQLGGKSTMLDESGTLSINQNLTTLTETSLIMGASSSPISKGQWLGLRLGSWWREETFQTTVEVRSTKTNQAIIDTTDTNGQRVTTPADLGGVSYLLDLMHFATPTTIVKASVSSSTNTGRPPASSFSLELRQFLSATESAIHLGVMHYENVGELRPVTLFGGIVANSLKGEWHQRLYENFIAQAGYRYYMENESPRDPEISDKKLGTDWIYASLRMRSTKQLWVDQTDEFYVFGGLYKTNEPRKGQLIGVGGLYNF